MLGGIILRRALRSGGTPGCVDGLREGKPNGLTSGDRLEGEGWGGGFTFLYRSASVSSRLAFRVYGAWWTCFRVFVCLFYFVIGGIVVCAAPYAWHQTARAR